MRQSPSETKEVNVYYFISARADAERLVSGGSFGVRLATGSAEGKSLSLAARNCRVKVPSSEASGGDAGETSTRLCLMAKGIGCSMELWALGKSTARVSNWLA